MVRDYLGEFACCSSFSAPSQCWKRGCPSACSPGPFYYRLSHLSDPARLTTGTNWKSSAPPGPFRDTTAATAKSSGRLIYFCKGFARAPEDVGRGSVHSTAWISKSFQVGCGGVFSLLPRSITHIFSLTKWKKKIVIAFNSSHASVILTRDRTRG